MKFIHVVTPDGTHGDINVARVSSVEYVEATHMTIFTLGTSSVTVRGDWSKKFRAFLTSGAVWTDGKIYEYHK